VKKKIRNDGYTALQRIKNQNVHEIISSYIHLCNPSSVEIFTDSLNDLKRTREAALHNHEEALLKIPGHTIHFDSSEDQGRDKEHTKFLLSSGVDLGPEINSLDREKGLSEIHDILKNSMTERTLYIKFYCLGPLNSLFSLLCLQLTDSAYVAHSEDLLYRQGYQQFTAMKTNEKFFTFIHTQGALKEAGLGLRVSSNIQKRRVYIDLHDEIIFSTNTQYGGNTIGLKKLAMRLAIQRASQEGWLTEHMLIMGITGPKQRRTYITGAFPSMCGKTSTAMIKGETIVGDDIAYLRKKHGKIYAVNVEKGVFGIIEGINSVDDPLQWKALHTPGDIIFSNVLVTPDQDVYWNKKDGPQPPKGVNFTGEWYPGKKDSTGKEVTASHKNARFTFDLALLDNVDPNLHNPEGVEIQAILYGGRDSDTWVPVEEAFDWEHGIVTKGASLESETTAATLGKEGVRVFNPMSNLDFLSISIGRYIQDNLAFGKDLRTPPRIYSMNYFLRDANGRFLNSKNDKQIWLHWIEQRVHNEVDALKAPTGYIPRYHDLKRLFDELQHKPYTQEEYTKQFTIRILENLAKIQRLSSIYQTRVHDTPPIVLTMLNKQKKWLEDAQDSLGSYILPDML